MNGDLTFVRQNPIQIENLVRNAGNSLTKSFQHKASIIDQRQQQVNSLVVHRWMVLSKTKSLKLFRLTCKLVTVAANVFDNYNL